MKKIALILFAGLAPLLFSPVFAQNENIIISPQAIVINPIASEDYKVEISIDKDTSGDLPPAYTIGDNISISVTTNQDSYVYLFNVRSDNTVDQIIPNRFDDAGKDNYVTANTTKTFPPVDAAYNFSVDGPAGLDKVIAVASKTQLDVSELANFSSNPNFASSKIGEEGFAKTLSIIIEPIEQSDWITDTVLFFVVDPSPQLPTPVGGTVFVTANVTNAAVYLEDVFQGYTVAGQALSFSTSFGVKLVRLSAPGYHDFEQIIHPTDGRIDLRATLTPLVRQVTVDLEAGPIWNQSDAQNKCSALANQYSGSWTGAWITTVQGAMSVCNITITTPFTTNLEAGPIWNQNDAQDKCPALANRLGGSWNGNWITTVQGAMSVCSIDF